MRVSRRVQLPVHVEVSPEVANRRQLDRSSGGTRAIPPLRLSLGACSHRRARLMADLLAARARLMFDALRHVTGMQEEDDSETRALEALIEMKGELKTYLRIIDRSDAPIPASELQKATGIRDLVSLNRELEKQSQGEAFNELVVGNAEMLKQSAIAKLSASSALADSPLQAAKNASVVPTAPEAADKAVPPSAAYAPPPAPPVAASMILSAGERSEFLRRLQVRSRQRPSGQRR